MSPHELHTDTSSNSGHKIDYIWFVNIALDCQGVSHAVCFTCVFTSVCVCVSCLLSEFVFGNKRSPPLTLLMKICRMLRKSRVTETEAIADVQLNRHNASLLSEGNPATAVWVFFPFSNVSRKCLCSPVWSSVFMTPRACRLNEKPAGVITGWTLGRNEVSFATDWKKTDYFSIRIFLILPREVCCVASRCWVVAD